MQIWHREEDVLHLRARSMHRHADMVAYLEVDYNRISWAGLSNYEEVQKWFQLGIQILLRSLLRI